MSQAGSFAGKSGYASQAGSKTQVTQMSIGRSQGASVASSRVSRAGGGRVAAGRRGSGAAQHKTPFNASKQEHSMVYDFAQAKGMAAKKIEALKHMPKKELNNTRMAVVKKAFKKVDKDGSGVLDLNDIRSTYNAKMHPKVIAGEWTEEEVLKKFLNKFETDEATRDGTVTWDEFRTYYEKLGATIKDDNYFVLMVCQAWQL
eukprot:Rmarinus@m.3865